VNVGVDVGIGIAAVGSVAAAVSARASARGVSLASRPYVYGEPRSATGHLAMVRLHNSGPGTAVEVRFRIGSPDTESTEWSQVVRAMQPGEVLPPHDSEGISMSIPVVAAVQGQRLEWWVEVEYGDIRGARWRLRNDRTDATRPAAAQRVRSGKFDRWRPC